MPNIRKKIQKKNLFQNFTYNYKTHCYVINNVYNRTL